MKRVIHAILTFCDFVADFGEAMIGVRQTYKPRIHGPRK